MVQGRQTTRQQCIDALREATLRLGHSPSRTEYEEMSILPSASAMYNRFGSWNKAKEAANLDTVGSDGGSLNVNEDYFNDIDCPEKAYWLGMLWADGYIAGNKIGLGLIDREHVESFRDAINSNHAISEDDGLYRVQIRSDPMAYDLIELGFTGNKTFDASLPPLENSDLRRAFVRGMFDGDGHYEAGRMRITSSSKKRLEKLSEWIPQGATVFDRGDGAYTLQTPTSLEFQLYSWLYDTDGGATNLKLQRKYDKWTEQMLSIA